MPKTTLIIGSGMAGLACATTLIDQTVIVLDKGHYPGGRMATRSNVSELAKNAISAIDAVGTLPVARWDYGAQYGKATHPGFIRWLEEMASTAFPPHAWPDESRFCISSGFRQLALNASFAAERGLTVLQQQTVIQIMWHANSERWAVTSADGNGSHKTWWADALVMTAPIPQALDLLGPVLPVDNDLHTIRYAPNLTLLLRMEPVPPLPAPGCLRNEDPSAVVGWVADNHAKQVSGVPGCWTVQASARFSQQAFDWPDEIIIETMIADLARQLAPFRRESSPAQPESVSTLPVISVELKRWRYALVTHAYAQSHYSHPTRPVWLAGDGFIGPRLEGAWLSGHSAAQAVNAYFSQSVNVCSR